MSAPAVQWLDAAAKDAPTALLLHGLENTWASWPHLIEAAGWQAATAA